MQEENSILHTFADNLRKIMAQKGVKQPQLATGSGVSQASISRYLNAETEPKISDFQKIAQFLNVTLGTLLGWDQPALEVREISDTAYKLAETYDGSEEEKRKRYNEIVSLQAELLNLRNRVAHSVQLIEIDIQRVNQIVAALAIHASVVAPRPIESPDPPYRVHNPAGSSKVSDAAIASRDAAIEASKGVK